jgi:HD-GYP domain-containing protein (c-di-GMP phosphodiesterase class II)
MDPINRSAPPSLPTPPPTVARPPTPAPPVPQTEPTQLESLQLTDLSGEISQLVPPGGSAWMVAAQLSGTTWSWIKKIYPECEDNDNEAESCLYSALSEVAPPSFEHSNRVGQLATKFAQHLGLSQPAQRNLKKAVRFKECGFVALQMHLWSDDEKEQAAETISLGGAFHDIGKIAISRDILNKPSRLTPEERTLIEMHPLIGEALLRNIPSARPLLAAVRNHHEWWDGSGYVDGLSGEAIPWEARVIAIVDSFDAMTEGRPYRKAFSELEACMEILSGRGTQFDPALAERFAEMFI